MANMTFGVNILPKANADVSIGNSDNPWTIVSPELTGTPTAPTAASGTDNTQIATTAFVNDAIPGVATQSADGLMSSSDKTKLDGVATGATANVGTITGINMNGASKGTSGVVDLGTVITAHQDLSGLVHKTGAETITGNKVFQGNVTVQNGANEGIISFSGQSGNAGAVPEIEIVALGVGREYDRFWNPNLQIKVYSTDSDGEKSEYCEIYGLPAVDGMLEGNEYYSILTTKDSLANNLTTEYSGMALDARQGKVLNDSTVKLTGTQTIAGTKTFTSIPYFKNSTTSPSVIFQGTDLANYNARLYASGCEDDGKYGRPYFNFYEYSPSSDGTSRTDYYEAYRLPAVNAGRIANGSYQILTTKENAIYDGLDSTNTSRPLSANQGKALNDHFGAYGYGTCATAAATTAKAATLANYELHTGSIVAIRFTYAVPASATLNVNSKGAKAIRYRNAAIAANIIRAGDTATFAYDGTYYHLIAVDPGNMTWGQLCST